MSNLIVKNTVDGTCFTKCVVAAPSNVSLRVIGDKVVCRAIDADAVTPGGIFLPEQSRERTMKGTVLFVGTGKRTEKGEQLPIGVKPGDTVLFPKYGWSEVKIDGETYLIVNGSDILAVVE